MHRNVTAVYRTHATAELVRRELEAEGLTHGHVRVVPDQETATETDRRGSRYMDALHDLHLPENDLRAYQGSVRRGDYVVSAEVDDARVHRVQEIMRRPEAEAYDLNALETSLRDEEFVTHSDPGRRPNPEWLGERDASHVDPYLRSYNRRRPIEPRSGY